MPISDAAGRVWTSSHWRRADFNEVLRTGWPDLDPKRTVLLEHAPAGLPRVDAAGENGSARLLHYGNTEVVVAVDAPMPAILLLNDVWHPWWRATLDGQPADILRANVIFRAVVLPPGTHNVRFTFAPFTGAVADLAGLAGLAH